MSAPQLLLSQAHLEIGRERFKTRDYVLHQAVADLFGDRPDRGYLFYELGPRTDRTASLLILSTDPPDDSLPTTSPSRLLGIRSKQFELGVPHGTPLDFEIRLNATVVQTTTTGGSRRTKRRCDVWDAVWGGNHDTPKTPDDVYGDYLKRKLSGAAEVLATRVVARERITMSKRPFRDQKPIFFVATTLIGTLRVSDGDALTDIIAHGIGRAKAFGCGLLCVSPPGSVLPRRYRSEHL